jgi:hypothetical protein
MIEIIGIVFILVAGIFFVAMFGEDEDGDK